MIQIPETIDKIEQLVDLHGPIVRELIDAGRISTKQVGNFYGRAVPRRQAILVLMQRGASYSKAYANSNGQFDTKNWGKVKNRAAAARGHVLTVATKVSCGNRDALNNEDVQKLHSMAGQLNTEVAELSRYILACDAQEVEDAPKLGRVNYRRANPEAKGDACRFTELHAQLTTAISKIKKTSRDVPHMLEQVGELPTVRLVAETLVEIGRIAQAFRLLDVVLERPAPPNRELRVDTVNDDPWGIGLHYARSPGDLREADVPTHCIVTHRQPDADALVSAWLAERYLFANHKCHIEFVDGRNFDASADGQCDCVVDVGRINDPERRIFDHKPPAFADRDQTCAAKLVWEHLRGLQHSVDHLADLIELVHDGDAVTRRSRSSRYAQSRKTGLHALISHAHNYSEGDQMLYRGIKVYLDGLF